MVHPGATQTQDDLSILFDRLGARNRSNGPVVALDNNAIVALDPTQSFCVYSPTATDLVIDFSGWWV